MGHFLRTEGVPVSSNKQNLNSDLDCITQSIVGHTHRKKYTQSLSTVLQHWVAFSFQRDLTSKRAYFTFQRRALTQNTQTQAQVQTHTQTLAPVNSTQMASVSRTFFTFKLLRTMKKTYSQHSVQTEFSKSACQTSGGSHRC